MDPSEFKTKPQRRRTLRKAYTKTEGIYYVFFKEDQKPVTPGILSRIIIQIQKKRGLNLATEGKDTPSNKNEGQKLATEGG